VVGGLRKRLRGGVRRDQRHAAGREVDGHGFQRRPQVVFGGHVHYGVVEEDRIEGAPEANVAHVAGEMLALGV
jgi:hypothetical protein